MSKQQEYISKETFEKVAKLLDRAVTAAAKHGVDYGDPYAKPYNKALELLQALTEPTPQWPARDLYVVEHNDGHNYPTSYAFDSVEQFIEWFNEAGYGFEEGQLTRDDVGEHGDLYIEDDSFDRWIDRDLTIDQVDWYEGTAYPELKGKYNK